VTGSVWSEQELVRRCKEGSEAAYAELVRQHRQRLLNLAFRLTNSRETAEDVVQETFLAAFRGMERFTPRPALAPWITTICVRLAGRAGQRRSATRIASLDQLAEMDSPAALTALFGGSDGDGRDPHAAAEASELRQALTSAIAALPYKQRVAVVLRFVSSLDYADAAQAMDVPLNTYKSHLFRGTRQLRDVLLPLMRRGEEPIEPTGTGPGAHDGDHSADGSRSSERSIGRAIPVAQEVPVVDEIAAAAPAPVQPTRAIRSA
jgi:RNA polymerase sigma-70 factor, ECF subfamily